MRKLVLTFLTFSSLIGSTKAQTLFTYGGNPVSKDEFLRVYQKNAMNKKPDFSEAALREYFDLYSLFRMKVKEAELRKIDTLPGIQRELDNYRKQLAKNYLTDEQVNNRLMREAYDRLKEERRVSHILLMAPPGLNPDDTLRLYKRMDSVYEAITKKGARFEELARTYSDDKGTKDNGGDLGYMTALQTLYNFESAVYETPVGKISRPFRTALGYHIVKVTDKRPARGEVQVAQILLTTPKSQGEAGEKLAQARLDSIRILLDKGTAFEEVVKRFSQDKYSINEGGVLKPFGVGRMTPAFEDAAFGLNKPGELSKPVKTEFGYHILKLISKTPLKPYDSMVTQLKKRVDNDSRAQIARDIFFDRLKQRNGFKEYSDNFDDLVFKFDQRVSDTGRTTNQFKADEFRDLNRPLFSLGKTDYSQADFMRFAEMTTRGRIMGQRKTSLREIYKMYLDRVVNDAEEGRLMKENADFRNLMTEYRDGIMLFELMDQQVWSKASKDSAGLKSFYDKNKAKYQWEPGFEGVVARFKDESTMKKGATLLGKMSVDAIADSLNTESMPDAVSLTKGRFEYSKFKEADRADIRKGIPTAGKRNNDGTITVVYAEQVYDTPGQKTLDEARGYVIAEYQDFLEKDWNATLRAKYPVKIEEPVFKTMVRK